MGNKVTFEIEYIKWYLVDTTNWHHPVIVRKHFYSRLEARTYRDKHFPDFEVIKGKEALALGLKDWHNAKPKHRHSTRDKSKYDFPEHIKTQYDKKKYRIKMRRHMKKPKLTKAVVREILYDNPLRFILIEMRAYRKNHWAFSDPVDGFEIIKKKFGEKMQDIVHVSNIIRHLKKEYDCGGLKRVDVALKIYDIYGHLMRSRHQGMEANPTNKKKVREELVARGYVEKVIAGHCVMSNINVPGKKLYYPKLVWHSINDFGYPDGEYIYDLLGKVGIPGFTKAEILGLASRK